MTLHLKDLLADILQQRPKISLAELAALLEEEVEARKCGTASPSCANSPLSARRTSYEADSDEDHHRSRSPLRKLGPAAGMSAQPQQCKRCRTWGPVEIHHWAPHTLFADHMAWPTAPLCRRCHDEWHRTLAAAAAKKGGAIFGRGFAPEAKEPPEIGVGPPTACPDVRGLCDDDAAEAMAEWFRENFEDPAESTPYDGGYVYIWGGPYNARDELEDTFGEVASEHALEVAVNEIESDGWEWAPSSQRRGPQP